MNEHELMRGYDLTKYHCYVVEPHGWERWPCPQPAAVFFEDADGRRRGYCVTHRFDGEREARLRHWTTVTTKEAAA
jgi:hypothetical protein